MTEETSVVEDETALENVAFTVTDDEPRTTDAEIADREGIGTQDVAARRKGLAVVRQRPILTDASKEIVKRISRASYTGFRQSQIFDDWLEICEICLDRLPSYWNQAAHGEKIEDPPDIAERWKPFADRYGKGSGEAMRLLAECFGIWLDSAAWEDGALTFSDVLGDVYMQYVCPSDARYKGQFFTPFHIAQFMAEITYGGGPGEQGVIDLIDEHLNTAMEHSQLYHLGQLMAPEYKFKPETKALILDMDGSREFFEPVTVLDPAVGSGVMLLAFASVCPPWAIKHRCVEFYGQDIDATCVKMAQLNMRLYGLNGTGYYLTADLETFARVERLAQAQDDRRREKRRQAAEQADLEHSNAAPAIASAPAVVNEEEPLPLAEFCPEIATKVKGRKRPIVVHKPRAGHDGHSNGNGHRADASIPLFDVSDV